MLDMEAFTFLHRILESEVSPIIVFATNRGKSKIRLAKVFNKIFKIKYTFRNTDEYGFYGIPSDLIDRLLIVPTRLYSQEEMSLVCLNSIKKNYSSISKIIQIRAEAEGVRLSLNALNRLCEIGQRASLRYTIQLLTPAKLLSHIGGRETVEVSYL
jgi:RuvB-like protein 1 (pontin 52)